MKVINIGKDNAIFQQIVALKENRTKKNTNENVFCRRRSKY